MSRSQMEVSAGQLLAGKYRIDRVLGRGGMGVVVAAHHIALDQVVTIKFLLPEALHRAEAVARFEREARAAVKIQSEHVARVTDVGRLDNGAPYMVMELLRGRDLEVLLRERGPLPLTDVADYVLQAGEAIAEAHGLGIVHRDLKPPNLFLTTRADGSSCVKVLDFGISKLVNASSGGDQAMTSTTAVMGSPLYMSPEQLMSARDVDMRTDIWALGVICFELLTGKLPFQADTLPQLCMAISITPPTPLHHYRPDLPPQVDALLRRCLSKDPGSRYPTVAALAADLVEFAPAHSRLSAERIERLARAAGFSSSAPAPLPASASTERVSADVASTAVSYGAGTVAEFVRTRPSVSSSKARWGLGLAGILAVSGGAGAYLYVRTTPAPVSDPSSLGAMASPSTSVSLLPSTAASDSTVVSQVVQTAPVPPEGSALVPQPVASAESQGAGTKPVAIAPNAPSLASKSLARSKPVAPSQSMAPDTKPPAPTAFAASPAAPATAPTPTVIPTSRSRL